MPGWKHDHSIPPNASIQLDDAELLALGREGSSLILDLQAYVHRSHGIPGTDPGAVLLQPAAIILANGRLLGPEPELPCTIEEGEITAGGQVFDEIIPFPFGSGEAAAVDLTLSSGQRLRIDADPLHRRPGLRRGFRGLAGPRRGLRESVRSPACGLIRPITGPRT